MDEILEFTGQREDGASHDVPTTPRV
jgi:hypothetical protein